ncbi:MAG: hypothetical protein WBZ33_04255, partial [Thermoactinomyces sp.]
NRVKPFDDQVIRRWVEEFGQSRPGGILPESIREDLRKNRAMANTPEGYPVINGDPALEEHLYSGILSINNLSFLLLVTDGMYPWQEVEEDWVRKIGREGLEKMMEFLCQITGG